MASRYDLVVIGGGSAGLVPAAGAASLGARVALVEKDDKLGGECLNRACVPTKTLVKSARVAHLVSRAGEFGVDVPESSVNFPAVMRRMRRVVETIGEADDPGRFTKMGVDLFLGREARFESPYEVSVDGRRLATEAVIVATGSHPSAPPIKGLEEVGYLTYAEALELTRLPISIVVIGAGPVGTEFAQIFARFGSKATLIDTASHPLPIEDKEIGEALKGLLSADGVSFRGNLRVEEAREENGEKVLVARNEGGEEVELRAEEVLVALGREPTVGGLGLENAGIQVVEGGFSVDEYLRACAHNVYAAGDVVAKYPFTHVAEYQGRIALRNALFPVKSKAGYEVVPWTTFTDPEVARVGLTEEQARERHRYVEVYRQPFGEIDRAVTDGETSGLVKIITGRRGKILGGHIIGPDAGNLIAEIVLAMQKNVPIGNLSQTIHAYPTLAQANQRAADSYYRQKLFTNRNRKVLSTLFGLRRGLKRRRVGKGVRP